MNPTTPPRIQDLLTRFLDRQTETETLGLSSFDASEVLPYDAGPVQPIDARRAWDEAVAVLGSDRPAQAPPHWAQLVAQHEPVVALAFAVGNFPQLMRNFHLLLHQADLTGFRPTGGRPLPAPELLSLAEGLMRKPAFPDVLIAIGTLRLARQFEMADKLIQAVDGKIPARWQNLWANEIAALRWHQGRSDEAINLWQSLEPTLPVRFNLAMSALFVGTPAKAQPLFDALIAELPETGAWHHLARLYRTLAGQ